MIIVIKQWLNYLILWSKNTEVKTIILPTTNKNVGISSNIKNDNPIPKIGNKEYEGKIWPTV
jgi:hypothetical protein